mmetsp:Transcript_60923/g.146693  ORF Transcript_60923/g.146693 Transcript_60923/m.146693 type:complete len:211 (+) Transcript_60923:36-668(+)
MYSNVKLWQERRVTAERAHGTPTAVDGSRCATEMSRADCTNQVGVGVRCRCILHGPHSSHSKARDHTRQLLEQRAAPRPVCRLIFWPPVLDSLTRPRARAARRPRRSPSSPRGAAIVAPHCRSSFRHPHRHARATDAAAAHRPTAARLAAGAPDRARRSCCTGGRPTWQRARPPRPDRKPEGLGRSGQRRIWDWAARSYWRRTCKIARWR